MTAPLTLVVGAAGALGSAVSTVLAEGGASVVAADLAPPEAVVAGLAGRGHAAGSVDVTDEDSVDELVAGCWAEAGFGGVVYAAGVNYSAPVADTSWPDYQRLMEVNLRGAFVVGKSLARRLREAPRPLSAVFLSSTAGLRGEAGGSVYCATKFGLLGFVQSFAAEIAAAGGRANAVCPGNVDSPMLRGLAADVAARSGRTPEQVLAEFAAGSAYNRLLDPREVASVCAWLLSPASSGLSGQTVVVDGPPPTAEVTT